MASINPLLKILVDTRHRLEGGESLRNALYTSIEDDVSEFAVITRRWLASIETKGQVGSILEEIKSPYRRVFLEVISGGITGLPVHQTLVELEDEVRQACEIEIEAKLKRLPFLSLLPVLFLMFPAFLLLLFGPMLVFLLKELSQ